MADLNVCTVQGRIVADPERRNIKKTNGDETQVVKIRVAVNRNHKSQGNDVNDTVFLDCEVWDKAALVVEKFFAKGDPILIRGSLKQDNWKDKDTGAARSKIGLRVDDFHFCPGYSYTNKCWGKGDGEAVQKNKSEAPAGGVSQDDDGDIPF